MSSPSLRRAVGIVRVSTLGEDAVSPLEQRERIASMCRRDGFELITDDGRRLQLDTPERVDMPFSTLSVGVVRG